MRVAKAIRLLILPIAVVILIFVIYFALRGELKLPLPRPGPLSNGEDALETAKAPREAPTAPLTEDFIRRAADIAFEAALKWRNDAKLIVAHFNEPDPSGTGRRDHFLFGSARVFSKEFEVIVRNGVLVSAREVETSSGARPGGGLALEVLGTIEETIAQARTTPGYENEELSGPQLMWNNDAGAWYWVFRTEKGVLSIEAKKK